MKAGKGEYLTFSDIPEDKVCSDQFFIDQRIDTNALWEMDIVDVFHQGDGFFDPVIFGHEAGDDVCLTVRRYSNKCVHFR